MSHRLNIYWKQGDEFNAHLTGCGGKVPEALESWASSLEKGAEKCRKLAQVLQAPGVRAVADTYMIEFFPATRRDDQAIAAIEEAAGMGLVEPDPFESE